MPSTPEEINRYAVEIVLLYLFLFIFGCFVGYLIELLFRRFVSAKKWVNPGFMKGPWLPLYGFGTILMFSICWALYDGLPIGSSLYNPLGNLYGQSAQVGANWLDLVPLVIIGLSLILLEFLAGLIFIKGFKVKLWDYSNMKGNIMGIICPVFNLIWFAVGVGFYYLINPYLYAFAQFMYDAFFGTTPHFGWLFCLGIIYGIFLVDLVKSLGVFAKITAWAKQSGIILKYEKSREEQKERLNLSKKKFLASLPGAIQTTLEESKKKRERKVKEDGKFRKWVARLVLIDPDKKKENNYDENGRPITIEDNEGSHENDQQR